MVKHSRQQRVKILKPRNLILLIEGNNTPRLDNLLIPKMGKITPYR